MTNLIGLLAYLFLGMALSETQTLGFDETVRKMLSEVRRALEKARGTSTACSGAPRAPRGAVGGEHSQEAAKLQAKEATNTFVAMKHQLCATASRYFDMAIAALGKDTDEAKTSATSGSFRARTKIHT